MNLEELYQNHCRNQTDINDFLPALRKYASLCKHVTEFGSRTGCSTTALLAAQPDKLISYDIALQRQYLDPLFQVRGKTEFLYYELNVIQIPPIEPTDMLFIDTMHAYRQMKRELELHGDRVKKYLAFHDWVGYAYSDEVDDGTTPKGIRPAIEEWMVKNPQWEIVEEDRRGWGLLVLRNHDVK